MIVDVLVVVVVVAAVLVVVGGSVVFAGTNARAMSLASACGLSQHSTARNATATLLELYLATAN